ncbi:hypothetical protein Tsubulata_007156 [Turnera subulata]|uniref:Protein kinase domain-containing protein n=1 Tax=Turnera subulata TaxID=218843 RepID=A0A9Q0FCZ7_9ROSI|nr:hypothetical protein Tsubulata_007156 [Turnera subulata]
MLLASLDCLSSSSSSSSILSSPLNQTHRIFSVSLLSRTRRSGCRARLITSPDSFEVGRLIGSYGFMNPGMDFQYSSSPDDLRQLKVQDVGEGGVKIRLYEGRIAQGPLRGTSVMFKVYPGQRAGGIEADMMAANELNAHAFLQSSSKGICQNLLILVGGFETNTGEQGAMRGLAYLHEHERLHQSLGPSSIVLNTLAEKEAAYLVPRLRDLAFSVDIRMSNMEKGIGALAEGLWRRATAAGAFTPMEKKTFGIADDIYEAGLLLAYLAFVPFCEAGIVDSLSLQRLLESTFRLDLDATREYCLADDRMEEAVKFLDLDDGAGWELLQAMLNPDFRKRPMAEAEKSKIC